MQNQFLRALVHGVKLENMKTCGDCFGCHFDERLYFTGLMDVTEHLSSLTLGVLHDTGWCKAQTLFLNSYNKSSWIACWL